MTKQLRYISEISYTLLLYMVLPFTNHVAPTVWHNLNQYVILNPNPITQYQSLVMGLVFKLTTITRYQYLIMVCLFNTTLWSRLWYFQSLDHNIFLNRHTGQDINIVTIMYICRWKYVYKIQQMLKTREKRSG